MKNSLHKTASFPLIAAAATTTVFLFVVVVVVGFGVRFALPRALSLTHSHPPPPTTVVLFTYALPLDTDQSMLAAAGGFHTASGACLDEKTMLALEMAYCAPLVRAESFTQSSLLLVLLVFPPPPPTVRKEMCERRALIPRCRNGEIMQNTAQNIRVEHRHLQQRPAFG